MDILNEKDNEKVESYYGLLVYLYEQKEVKTLDPILKERKIHSQVGTVLKTDGILLKDGNYKWNTEMQPTRELAISLNKEVKLYGKWRNEMDYFDNSLKCQEEHPIDFDKAWVNLGFSRRQEGKRSLLGVCDEGKDFDLRINAQLTGVLEEKRGDYEIIKLSADGFIKWAMYAQTPVAKASVGELIKRLRYITKENTELKKSIRAQSWKAYHAVL